MDTQGARIFRESNPPISSLVPVGSLGPGRLYQIPITPPTNEMEPRPKCFRPAFAAHGVILNTTPHPVPPLQTRSPPAKVVPYRFPRLSIIKFPSG